MIFTIDGSSFLKVIDEHPKIWGWSGGSMFYPLSHIYLKIPFCCIKIVANNTLNHQHIFDWLWANMAPTLNTAFSLTKVHAKCWIHCLLISSTPLLSCNFNLWKFKMILEFFGVFRDNCQILATWTFSIICVCTTTCKVSILPLNCCFQWSRVRITLIKPLFCLNSIFPPIRKQCFINTQNSDFSIVFENLKQ